MSTRSRPFIAVAIVGMSALVLAACAGGAGGASGSVDAGGGFEFEAEQSVVDELVADLEPVTLVLSSDAPSADALNSLPTMQFKDEIEARSNGKISLDVAWSHSIAGSVTEVPTALADGRVDLSTGTLVYHPQEFPAYNELNALSRHVPSSPMSGLAAAAGVLPELAWQNDLVMEEIRDAGLVPLNPVMNTGEFYYFCGEESTGNQLSDWSGRQVRAGTTLHTDLTDAMGATTVSMEWLEVYEALQRRTVDCTVTLATTALPTGVAEIAPNISYPDAATLGGQGAAGLFAGSSFNDLPLAYQQIIFDAEPAFTSGNIKSITEMHVEMVEEAKAAGGEVDPLPVEVEEQYEAVWDDAIADGFESGLLPEGSEETTEELADKWRGIVAELGFEDGGDLGSMGEWFDRDSADFRPVADRIYKEVALPHRPS